MASNALQSCSGLIQGCGQFLSDKAAPVVTAMVVGTATMGAVAIKNSGREDSRPPVVHNVAPAVSTALSAPDPQPTASPAKVKGAVKGRTAASSAGGQVEALSKVPLSEPPAVSQPVPQPSPSSTPPPVGTSGGVVPEPSSPPAPVVPEPKEFSFSFTSDLPGEGAPCSCVSAGTEPILVKISVTEQDGLLYLDHLTRSAASAAGTPFYGLDLRHIIQAGRGHAMDFVLQRPEGMFRYTGTGARVEKVKTEWGGWLYRYSGTYRLYSRPGGSEKVPLAGTYAAELTVSWRQNRVLSSNVSLTEG